MGGKVTVQSTLGVGTEFTTKVVFLTQEGLNLESDKSLLSLLSAQHSAQEELYSMRLQSPNPANGNFLKREA